MNLYSLVFAAFFSFFLLGCKPNNLQKENREIAAVINGETIYLDEIDSTLQIELYHIINQIYTLRKEEVDKTINRKIIELEAQKINVYPQQIIDSLLLIPVDSSIFRNILDKDLLLININNYKANRIQLFIDSIKSKYQIEIKLKPPSMPRINTNNIKGLVIGNIDSPVSVWLFSDLECSVCNNLAPIYGNIYEKYKDKVKFVFSYYSSDITYPAIALESANNQNKFWDMYKLLIKKKDINNIHTIINCAKKLNLDMNKFNQDIRDPKLKKAILNNYDEIMKQGIYQTPTILINGRIFMNIEKQSEIESAIDLAIRKF
ncbi:MAG: thioredoxin domain-containing protein [Dysgonomonas mossii]|uniref:DsbA family protein n=1 Tax=Dysgonomonas mossii TaxID=163665 RepID=UPI001DD5C798|nr:thioredoxin domain-containing protein [Dysgonomonas mossii]MBS5796821.1 thioredoxin domain-containing protein [Dysgonomonas mossii]MBS7112012.1 thioredoxin domain-containing protein [Dysgonomonas mossii]